MNPNESPQDNSRALIPNHTRPNQCWLLGLPFDALTLAEAVDLVRTAAQNKTPMFISTPNLNFLVASQKDSEFRDSVIHSDLSLADGMPIVWMAKLMGLPIKERVCGADLFQALRERPLTAGQGPIRIFFFGGPDGVAELACKKINEVTNNASQPSMICVGFLSPGFGNVEDMSSAAILNKINAANADFIVVSLGAKKGQQWIQANKANLNAPIISHLGAVVNFVAGTVNRAPLWVQKLGFEWAWRILKEPHLWRRYFYDGAFFIHLIIKISIIKLSRKAS